MFKPKKQFAGIVIFFLVLTQSAFAATNIGVNVTTDGNVRAGNGSLVFLGSQPDPDPAGPVDNGAMYYNTTNNKFRCYENSAWTDCISSAASIILSSVVAAVASNIINNGDNAQRWNWQLTTADKTAFTFGENVASTAGGAPNILKVVNMAGSTTLPLLVENQGNGHSFRVNDVASDSTPFLIDKDGNVGIGTTTFDPLNHEKLKVDAGVTTSSSIMSGYGQKDGPLYIEVKNTSATSAAMSVFGATADDGDPTANYAAMGITSSFFSDPAYTIAGPHDAFLFNVGDGGGSNGGNMIIGTGEPGMSIKFITGGGASAANEQMRINDLGNVGINTTTPGSELDVNGEIRFSNAASDYVGFMAPAAVTTSTTYTLPADDGTGGQALVTDGFGHLGWASATSLWQKIGTVLSPLNGTDDITTSGNIYTEALSGGTITSDGLLTGNTGLSVKGADVEINKDSNFNTHINTGTSTGTVNIGSPNAGAIVIESASTVTLQGGANTITSPTGEIKFQAADSLNTGLVKIGDGGAGSGTPDLLALDVKSTAGDPALLGTNGAMYYNANTNKFRCYVNGGWTNCASAALDTIIAAVAANTINNGDNAQRWNWSLTTPGKKGFTFGENVASTATGESAVLSASTLTSSTAMPLFVENLGNGYSFRVNDSSGDTTPFIIDSQGHVLIGTNTFGTPKEKLKVEAGVTDSPAVISAQGSINDGLYIEVHNRNSGTIASSAFGATADDGDATTNYATFGIASSGYNNPLYPILGAHDAFLFNVGDFTGTQGGNMIIGTGEPGKSVIFLSGGGASAANEQMRINSAGNVGINTTTPGSELDVKGTLRLSGATSGYVGFAPAAVAGSTTYTLPAADGTANQVLSTDGAGVLDWIDQSGVWQRTGTVISPLTAGDDITTSGDIYTTGTGTMTSAGLLVANGGITANAGDLSLNAIGAFNTNISTGGATGSVNIGNPLAAAIAMVSGGSLTLTGGAASTWSTTTGDITLQPGGSGTTGLVKIRDGGADSATPDLLALDVKSAASGAGDPVLGVNGAMYYNDSSNKFRCYVNGSWSDCDTTGGTASLQSAYNNGATITTAGSTDLALTLTSGNLTASGAGSVLLTPTGASSFTSGGALTLTGGAASTWSTSSGALTITSATAATWGTAAGDLTLDAAGSGISASVKIGTGGAGSTTPDLFGVDVKSTTGDPAGGYDGAMYYNKFDNLFRCYEAGGWKNCGSSAASATTLQQAYTAGPTITTTGSTNVALILTSGDFTASGAGAVNLTPTGASSFTSGGALTLTGGAASTWGTSTGNLTLQVNGAGTGSVKIGTGGAGTGTPDLLALDVKSDAGDPAGFAGAMYYNENSDRFRCYENGAWKDCDAGVVASLQTAYDNGGSIITSGSNPIDFTLTSGDFNVSGAGAVNLIPDGALTLTGGVASTFGTDAGNLTLQANGTGTGSVKIGTGGAGTGTPDLLALDVKSTAGDPAGFNGAIYYNANGNKFRCYQGGMWVDCDIRSIGTAKGDLIAYTGANTPVRLPVGNDGEYIVADSGSATGLKWATGVVGANSLDFTEFKDMMTVDANTSIDLDGNSLTINDPVTGGGALSMTTNGAALTLTADAASTWSTSTGALTIDSAAGLNLGTTNATAITIGKAGVTTTSVGPLQTGNSANTGSLRIADGSSNYITLTSPSIGADYTLTFPVDDGTNGQALTTNGTGTLSWSTIFADPMTTIGDLVYRNGSNITARLPISATVGTVLRSNGTLPAWTALTSSDVGLGNVTDEAQIPKSIGTTKGDIIVYTGPSTPTRLAMGNNGDFLTVDTTTGTGLKWAATSIGANSLDFTEFKDSMTVDAATSINQAGNSLTISGGALNLNTTGTANTSIGNATGALTFTSTNFNTTATGINSTAIGTTTRSTGAFTTLAGNGNITLGDATADTTTINSKIAIPSASIADGGTSNTVVGRVTSGGGNTTVVVNNSLVTTSSHVFIMPESARNIGNNEDEWFYVTPANGSFTITGQLSFADNMVFSWLVIN